MGLKDLDNLIEKLDKTFKDSLTTNFMTMLIGTKN